MRGLSLANKSQLLFGLAIAGILAATLVVPWERMRTTVEESQVEMARQLADTWLANGIEIQRSEGVPIPVRIIEAAEARESPDPFISDAWDRFESDGKTNEVMQASERAGSMWYGYARAIHESQWRMIGDRLHADFAPRGVDTAIDDPLRAMIVVERPSAFGSSLNLSNQVYTVVAGGIGLALAITVFWFIQRRLVFRPMRALRSTAERAQRGDLAARCALHTHDEFEDLSDAFDAMLESLHATHMRLEAVNRNLDLKVGELAEANVGLSESNRLKSEFLANVSHELRTPLNSIIGFAELLEEIARADGNADPKRIRYINNILRSGRMLLEMINELLDMAKIEAGRMEVSLSLVSIPDVAEGLVAIMQGLAEGKQVRLDQRCPSDLPSIETDPGKLQQILYNFVSNAIKFSPEGASVVISAEHLRADQHSSAVRISIIDHGPGVPWDMQETVFEKFRQADASHTRKHQGTGLGLAICKELSKMLGATVGLSSTPGLGATFWVEIPVVFAGRALAPLMADVEEEPAPSTQ